MSPSLRSLPWCLVLSLSALVGCGGNPLDDDDSGDDDSTEDLPDDPSTIVVQELRATIGAAGGALEGEADGAFAGFRLEVPAGALAADTELVVRATVDPTPLALTAERVGPQYSLEPAGLDLAAPVSVTVGFDETLRDRWEATDADCKVWYRDGAGWSRAEQTASTSTGVTVQLSRLTTVAAGVLFTPTVPSCTFTNTCPPTVGDQGCLFGDAFCLTRLVPPSAVPYEYDSIAVRDGHLWFLTATGTNRFALAAYDLSSTNGATTLTGELNASPSSLVMSRGRIAHDNSSNDVWLSLNGYGNVRFRPSVPAARFDTTSTKTPAGVTGFDSLSGVLRWHLSTVSGVRALRYASGSSAVEYLRLATGDTVVAASGIDVNASGSAVRFVGNVAAVAKASGIHPPRGSTAIAFDDVCGGVNNNAAAFEVSARHAGAACGRNVYNSAPDDIVDVGHSISTLTTDHDELVFVASSSIAEITRVGGSNDLTSIPLSTAAVGSDAYNARVVRALRYVPGLDMLVLITRGNNSNGAPDIYLVENFRD